MMGMSHKAYTAGGDFVMEGLGRVDESDRSFDIEYWQRQDSNGRFAAAWELVVFAHARRGGNVAELRLQRTIEHLERRADQVFDRRRLCRDGVHGAQKQRDSRP
jgi:hypothetical protein